MELTDVQLKMRRFREKHFKDQPVQCPSSVSQLVGSLAQLDPGLNKFSSDYYDRKISGQLLPFLAQKLEHITEEVIARRLVELEDERHKAAALFRKFEKITEIQDEKKELLGSDYISESENEEDYKQAFTAEDLALIEKHRIPLLAVLKSNESVQKAKVKVLNRYPKFKLSAYF